MSSVPPSRPVTPYAKFTDVPRSVTPLSVQAASTPPSSRPSEFPRQISEALALIEQSIIENVKTAMARLATIVIAKQDETRRTMDKRFDVHARELHNLRDALERHGVILPPPPDGL